MIINFLNWFVVVADPPLPPSHLIDWLTLILGIFLYYPSFFVSFRRNGWFQVSEQDTRNKQTNKQTNKQRGKQTNEDLFFSFFFFWSYFSSFFFLFEIAEIIEFLGPAIQQFDMEEEEAQADVNVFNCDYNHWIEYFSSLCHFCSYS